jgi:hypothetical protein
VGIVMGIVILSNKIYNVEIAMEIVSLLKKK